VPTAAQAAEPAATATAAQPARDSSEHLAEDQSPWARRRRWAAWVGGSVTFLLALLGAFTGTTTWWEARKVQLKAVAQPYSFYSRGPYGAVTVTPPLQVAVVNYSSRAVSVLGGEVRANGEAIGTLDRMAIGADESSRVSR
jgi:hypothetical protein